MMHRLPGGSADVANGRTLGRTGLTVSRLCIGTSAWGGETPFHPGAVPERQAVDTALSAFEGPINFIDTSNNYGDGEAERRLGIAIRGAGVPEGFVIQGKLDRDPLTDSFDEARMRSSLSETLSRLGLNQLPVLYLHDPEHLGFEGAMARGGPVETLQRLQNEGLVHHIGIAGGPVSMMLDFVETGVFDTLITHSRYTLVDRSADQLISVAHDAGIAVLNAAVFGGGVLSIWPRQSDQYHYSKAPNAVLSAIDHMGAACERFGVPLIAAAQQFSTRDSRITSTIVGVVSPLQLNEAIAHDAMELPDALWRELDDLCPPRDYWIGG
jgi:D-threo-aldose 1-dehydrogenase